MKLKKSPDKYIGASFSNKKFKLKTTLKKMIYSFTNRKTDSVSLLIILIR